MQENQLKETRILPFCFGPLKKASAHFRLTGPCGDTMEYWLLIRNDIILTSTYTTDGCEHSIACGNAAAKLISGLPLGAVNNIKEGDILSLAGNIPKDSEHCALLALNTIKSAVGEYHAKNQKCDNLSENCESCEKESCDSRKEPNNKKQIKSHDKPQPAHMSSDIKNKVVVLSGKGGVGKSTVSVNLAATLALQGKRVGLMDIDIHGPSIPIMLNLEGVSIEADSDGIYPVDLKELNHLKVVSIGFFLNQSDDPVIWRGPMKMGVIKQFLEEVNWGTLDYLIVDCPPGTGDEPLSVVQLLGDSTSALIVTTPQEVSAIDVSKSINFCRQLKLPIIGIIENMGGFICPDCGKTSHIFQSGGGFKLCKRYKIPFLGSIPIDPVVGIACDNGTPYVKNYPDSIIAGIYKDVSKSLLILEQDKKETLAKNADYGLKNKENTMKIAIPVANGRLNKHFGHCESFEILEINANEKKIVSTQNIIAPPHEPGLLPKWLGERGVNMIIAGGMGLKAQNLFTERNIQVITGALAETPEKLVMDFLNGCLKTGENTCDH